MRIRRIVIGIVVVPIAAFLLYTWVGVPLLWIITMPDTDAMRVRLLYQTDHQALLDACRELSRRVATKELEPGEYYLSGDVRPQVLTFPQIILDVEPCAVVVESSGRIDVAMIGGIDHIGVRAYPENYPSSSGFELGDRKLLEGLWYYDDGYHERPADWDKHIEKLRPQPKTIVTPVRTLTRSPERSIMKL